MLSIALQTIRRLGIRHVLLQALNFVNVIAPVLMIWKGFCVVTNNESPMVVVLSGSMEPAFYRGDIIFLTNLLNVPYRIGDITVYKIPGQAIPIVHRVIETHNKDGKQLLLTKGDNNDKDDLVLYEGLRFIENKHIIGKVQGFLPYVGYITIAMNGIPRLKDALLDYLRNFAPIQ